VALEKNLYFKNPKVIDCANLAISKKKTTLHNPYINFFCKLLQSLEEAKLYLKSLGDHDKPYNN